MDKFFLDTWALFPEAAPDRLRQAFAGRFHTLEVGSWHVLSNPATPLDVFMHIADGPWGEWRRAGDTHDIGDHPRTPPEVLEVVIRRADWGAQENAGANPRLPQSVLLEYALSSDACHRARVARNPSLPHRVLETLLADENEEVRATAVLNPAATSEMLLAVLQSRPGDDTISCALSNPAMPEEMLRHSAGDWPHPVAWNPSTPQDLLADLARKGDESLRELVASNRSATPEVLLSLVDGASTSLLECLARNPSSPIELLVQIADLVPGAVAGQLRTPIEVLACVALEGWGPTEFILADHPSETLAELASHPEWKMRFLVANHRNVPAEVLPALAADAHEQVRAAVVRCPRTPKELFDELVNDPSAEVLRALGQHPSGPDHLRAAVALGY